MPLCPNSAMTPQSTLRLKATMMASCLPKDDGGRSRGWRRHHRRQWRSVAAAIGIAVAVVAAVVFTSPVASSPLSATPPLAEGEEEEGVDVGAMPSATKATTATTTEATTETTPSATKATTATTATPTAAAAAAERRALSAAFAPPSYPSFAVVEEGVAAIPPLRNPFVTFPPIPKHLRDDDDDDKRPPQRDDGGGVRVEERNDVFFADEEGMAPSLEEVAAMDYYWEERKAVGAGNKERLYDYPDDFIFDDTPPSPFVLLDFAQFVAGDSMADPSDFPSPRSKFAAAVVDVQTTTETTPSSPTTTFSTSSTTAPPPPTTSRTSSTTTPPPPTSTTSSSTSTTTTQPSTGTKSSSTQTVRTKWSAAAASSPLSSSSTYPPQTPAHRASPPSSLSPPVSPIDKKKDAGDGKWVRIAGSGFMLSEMTVQRHFCPEARRVAWAVAKGVKRLFTMPSTFLRSRRASEALYSSKAMNYGEISHEVVREEEEGRQAYHHVAPVVAVMEVPRDCLLHYIWRKRFHSLEVRAVDVVAIDEEGKRFVSTGEKMTTVFPVEVGYFGVMTYIGYYRYYKLVEELALNRHTQLRNVLDDYAKQFVKRKCEGEETERNNNRWERRVAPLRLRQCFFRIDRKELLKYGLGESMLSYWMSSWNRSGSSGIGGGSSGSSGSVVAVATAANKKEQLLLDSDEASSWASSAWLWTTPKVNPTYLKAVLCGAKEESWLLVGDVLGKSFIDSAVYQPVLNALRTGGLSLQDIPSDVGSLPGPYSKAAECSTESLMRFIEEEKGLLLGADWTTSGSSGGGSGVWERKKKREKGLRGLMKSFGAKVGERLRRVGERARRVMSEGVERLFGSRSLALLQHNVRAIEAERGRQSLRQQRQRQRQQQQQQQQQ